MEAGAYHVQLPGGRYSWRPGDRAAYRDAVDAVHRQVRSEPGSPVPYTAFDRDLQMWVAACLFVGLEDAYQLLRGKLPAELAEHFYRSAFTPAPRCR